MDNGSVMVLTQYVHSEQSSTFLGNVSPRMSFAMIFWPTPYLEAFDNRFVDYNGLCILLLGCTHFIHCDMDAFVYF